MITTTIPKDIRKFKTKFAFGMTFREFICFICAVAIAILIYNIQKLWTTTPEMGLCGFCLIPLAFGFIPENITQGMPLEKYLQVTFISNYVAPKVRIYKRNNPYRQFLSNNLVDEHFDEETTDEWVKHEYSDLDKKERKIKEKERKMLIKTNPKVYKRY